MVLGKRKIVALAMAEGSITAVEAVAVNGSGRIRRWAEFPLPDAPEQREPAALGKALRRLLREEGFSARRCVIGIGAAGLTARAKALPPASEEALPAMLALMVEREFGADRADLAVDYVADGGEGGSERTALLVAAPRRVLDELAAMANAAGLTVEGVTPSALALTGADPAGATERLVLHLFDGGAEMTLGSNGAVRMLRPLSARVADGRLTGAWLDGLADELYRVVALLPAEGPGGAEDARELVIWDENCLDERGRADLADRLGLPATVRRQVEGMESAAEAPLRAGAQASAAAAIALDAVRGRRPTIDLLHSRLAPPRKLAVGRKLLHGGAAAAIVLLAVAWLLLDWRSNVTEAKRLEAQLAGMADEVAQARAVIEKVDYARDWGDRRPSQLDAILRLTNAFPQVGAIWATSLTVKEDMRIGLSGTAVSKSAVLDLLDRLRKDPALADVKQEYIQQAGRRGEEVSFAMSFTYQGSNAK